MLIQILSTHLFTKMQAYKNGVPITASIKTHVFLFYPFFKKGYATTKTSSFNFTFSHCKQSFFFLAVATGLTSFSTRIF